VRDAVQMWKEENYSQLLTKMHADSTRLGEKGPSVRITTVRKDDRIV
jgi:hypothetical protein